MQKDDTGRVSHDPAETRCEPISPGQEGTSNNYDSNVFKTCEPITIPQQLLNVQDARFIRLETTNDKRKKPVDYKWSTERNYTASSAVMKGWLLGGNDYGVATGFGGFNFGRSDDNAAAALPADAGNGGGSGGGGGGSGGAAAFSGGGSGFGGGGGGSAFFSAALLAAGGADAAAGAEAAAESFKATRLTETTSSTMGRKMAWI